MFEIVDNNNDDGDNGRRSIYYTCQQKKHIFLKRLVTLLDGSIL